MKDKRIADTEPPIDTWQSFRQLIAFQIKLALDAVPAE